MIHFSSKLATMLYYLSLYSQVSQLQHGANVAFEITLSLPEILHTLCQEYTGTFYTSSKVVLGGPRG